MPVPCFVTDLDGTLLRSDATLSAYSVRVLTRALELGCIVSYATARSWTSSQTVASAVPWKYPVVLYNGALVFDPLSRSAVGGHFLAAERTDEIIERGRSLGFAPLLFALDAQSAEKVLHERLHRPGDLHFRRSRPGDPRFREMERLACPDDYRTLLLTYIGLREELAPLADAVRERYGAEVHIHFMKDNYIPEHYFLEFSHARANKRDGLRLWAEQMGVSAERITVFGDNLNDLGLYEAAGRRIAVANARPELRARADRVIESCDADGVARYVECALASLPRPDGGTEDGPGG